MRVTETLRKASLALAIVSTVVYWGIYLDNQHVTAERRVAMAASAFPMPLNGFRPILRGVLAVPGSAGLIEEGSPSHPRLLFVVRDTCPGAAAVLPDWLDWIAKTPNRGYSAVIVSTEGTNYLSMISKAFASRGIESVALQATHVQEFEYAAGVVSTPTLLALDRWGHVRLVSHMFPAAVRGALDEFLAAEENASNY